VDLELDWENEYIADEWTFSFMRNSKLSIATDLPPPLSVCTTSVYQFFGLLILQCFPFQVRFHFYHSLSRHSSRLSENKPLSVRLYWLAFSGTLNLFTHPLPSFIVSVGVLITVNIITCVLSLNAKAHDDEVRFWGNRLLHIRIWTPVNPRPAEEMSNAASPRCF
jgi:hypothetical protein